MQKRVILLRGLPYCGKSYTAKELAGEHGLIYSTDEYWYTQVNPEHPESYDFKINYLAAAHKWNLVRFQLSVNEGHPLIIVDNTNTTPKEMQPYASYCIPQGYEVVIQEPTSDRWMEIRELLKRKKVNEALLKEWALKLEEGSKGIHDVPAFAIERMMWRWQNDVTVEQILSVPPETSN